MTNNDNRGKIDIDQDKNIDWEACVQCVLAVLDLMDT
jgi:hypothetical protein